MPEQNSEELRERLELLESRVEELEEKVRGEAKHTPAEERSEPSMNSKDGKESSSAIIDQFQFSEQWLNRIGIGLLLIGVAFLFKYSVDQGWLIPPIRSAIGLGIGMALFGFGIRMEEEMNPFRQILLGGGIAVFYITGFATFQLYSFLPAAFIWAFMVVVTLLALSLSLQQDEAVLSVTGMLGALGTPFMLYTGAGNITMLMLYTMLVLGSGAFIYFRKGWSSLLWSMMVGGMGVLLIGVLSTMFGDQNLSVTEHWMMQVGIVIWIVATWGTADLRIVANPSQSITKTLHLSVFWVPLWLLPLMAMHWGWAGEETGILAFGIAALGGLGYSVMDRYDRPQFSFSHGLMAILLATIGLILCFDGMLLYAILVAEVVMLQYVARQTDDVKLNVGAHALFLIISYWTVVDLYYSVELASPLFSIEAFTQLAFIGAAGLVIPYWLRRSDFKMFYRITAHLLVLFWMYQRFHPFSNGQAWISAIWSLYAIALIIAGFTRYGQKVRLAGMSTVFLVVGKLFLVDLSQLQAIWRILLFIGLGGAFILLGYYLQSAWGNTDTKT